MLSSPLKSWSRISNDNKRTVAWLKRAIDQFIDCKSENVDPTWLKTLYDTIVNALETQFESGMVNRGWVLDRLISYLMWKMRKHEMYIIHNYRFGSIDDSDMDRLFMVKIKSIRIVDLFRLLSEYRCMNYPDGKKKIEKERMDEMYQFIETSVSDMYKHKDSD